MRAGTELADRLRDARPYRILDLLTAGATWQQIGDALDMTRQAAHKLYHESEFGRLTGDPGAAA